MPKSTLWKLEPHTRAKHAIVKRYLEAWTPILARGSEEIFYVDGFAGPGRYSGGEDGSPIIALKVAMAANVPAGTTIRFFFVERDKERGLYLEQLVKQTELPENFEVHIAVGKTFEEAHRKEIGRYDEKGSMPPTFMFVDPFGWAGVPYSTMKKMLSYRSCEVFATFMYEEINRFLILLKQENNFDAFFGTPDWRNATALLDKKDRCRFLHDLHLRQLKRAAKYVRSFEMRNDNDVTDYFLFFATNSLVGLRKMKESMWKADPTGEFRFSDATDQDQLVLFSGKPDFALLTTLVLSKFAGRETTVGQIEEFVLADTAFPSAGYKQEVLKRLEIDDPPRLHIIDPPRGRRRGTYSDPSLRLKFAPTS